MSDSQMVERVARALAVADGFIDPNERPEFEDDGICHWHFYVADARAAIEAMREHFKQSPEFHWAAIEAIDEALK